MLCLEEKIATKASTTNPIELSINCGQNNINIKFPDFVIVPWSFKKIYGNSSNYFWRLSVDLKLHPNKKLLSLPSNKTKQNKNKKQERPPSLQNLMAWFLNVYV